MEPLERLLPHLYGHVVDVGSGGKGGSFARLENDLYLRATPLPREESVDSLRLQFYLFFGADGSHAVPPFGILGNLLAIHRGYDMKLPGEFWGDRAVRAALRRLIEDSGWRDPSLVFMRVKKPRPELTSAPRAWASVGVFVGAYRRGELLGGDWAQLARQILSVDAEIVGLLEMVRPKQGAPPLHPH